MYICPTSEYGSNLIYGTVSKKEIRVSRRAEQKNTSRSVLISYFIVGRRRESNSFSLPPIFFPPWLQSHIEATSCFSHVLLLCCTQDNPYPSGKLFFDTKSLDDQGRRGRNSSEKQLSTHHPSSSEMEGIAKEIYSVLMSMASPP